MQSKLLHCFKCPISTNFSVLQASVEKRLVEIFTESLKFRLENNVKGNDFLGSLIDLRQAGAVTDREIISHLGNFYVDGVDTSGIILHFVLYELAGNPEVQEKLKKEVDDVMEKNNEIVSFEVIQGMKYLDAVVNGEETRNSWVEMSFYGEFQKLSDFIWLYHS